MVDRLISHGVSVIVMGLVALTFGGAVVLAYRGLFELLNRNFALGGVMLAGVVPLALSARILIRNKDDLMDR